MVPIKGNELCLLSNILLQRISKTSENKMAASHSLAQDSLQGYPRRDVPIPQKSNITATFGNLGMHISIFTTIDVT